MRDAAYWPERLKKLGGLAGKYKYVFLVLLAGVVLLLLPGRDKAAQSASARDAPAAAFDVGETEQRLEQALSRVDGAGEVTVVLTLKSTARQILAQDGETSEKGGDVDAAVTTVVVSRGSGTQETVPLQQLSPEFQGALVVCSGGGDASVRLRLVEAVSALTGLGSDKISVCKSR